MKTEQKRILVRVIARWATRRHFNKNLSYLQEVTVPTAGQAQAGNSDPRKRRF